MHCQSASNLPELKKFIVSASQVSLPVADLLVQTSDQSTINFTRPLADNSTNFIQFPWGLFGV